MMKGIIDRLNRVPEKNFIAFLETLGIKLLPANAATAPITFALAEGTKEPVLIPERTQIAAGDEIFETKKNMLATPAKLMEAYCVDLKEDKIYGSPVNFIPGEPVIPFSTVLSYDAEPHAKNIFLNDTEGLNKGDNLLMGKSEYAIISAIIENRVELSGEIDGLKNLKTGGFEKYPWGTVVEKATDFPLFEGKDLQEHVLYVGHKDMFNIKGEAVITIKNLVKKSVSVDLDDIRWEYWGASDNREELDWYELKPIEKSQSSEIKLRKDTQGEIKETIINGVKSRWIRGKSFNIFKTKDLLLDDVKIIIGDISHKIVPSGDLPIRSIRGIGKEFDDRLSRAGITTVGKLLNYSDNVEYIGNVLKTGEQSSKYYLEQAENIIENAQKLILDMGYEDLENNLVNIPIETEFFAPDMAFYNDVPLNLEQDVPFYPFGKAPKLNDTFYIGSQEAFSKKGADITLDFTLDFETTSSKTVDPARKLKSTLKAIDTASKNADPPISTVLSWEYWDGKGWVPLKISNAGKNLDISGKTTIKILNFPELKPTLVNGQENYWIRIRLMGGDYGREVIIETENIVKKGNVTPPKITNLSITYHYGDFQKLEHIFSLNNLEYVDITAEFNKSGEIESFEPFIPLEDEHQILYLGFDKKLEKGPINLFFSIKELNWPEDNLPRIKWQYYSENNEWKILEASDDTRGFTRTGTIEFVFPSDFKQTKRFGKELFWIRAVDEEDTLKLALNDAQNPASNLQTASKAKSIVRSKKSLENITEEITACSEAYNPEWIFPGELKNGLSPKISGIYTNTVWAVCWETKKDEILGSGDGTKFQKFNLIKNPIISEEIWVNEIKTITETEKINILEKNQFETEEIKDEHGKITEFWIKWNPVEDILFSESNERNYEINRFSGEVTFGNQIHGKIPPIGRDNIKANYIIGGGNKGNKPINQIKDIKSSIPFVDKASNYLSSDGGSDFENIESAMERAPRDLKNRGRAISSEDFENIAYQASRAISRVKCLSNINNNGKFEPGWVTVLVIPQSVDKRPKLSLQLKKQVQAHLKANSTNTLTLNVTEPLYVETSLNASIITVSPDVVPDVEKEALSLLSKFLHPINGGYDGRGWEFGRAPCISDFYALLEKIDGVDHVQFIEIKLKDPESNVMLSSEMEEDIKIPSYAVVYNGVHKLNLDVVKTGGEF